LTKYNLFFLFPCTNIVSKHKGNSRKFVSTTKRGTVTEEAAQPFMWNNWKNLLLWNGKLHFLQSWT